MIAIYPIVEGHGEVRAAPILIRRVASDLFGRADVLVLDPHRVPRGRMLASDGADLKRAVELGKRKIVASGRPGAVVVLLDGDDDCPAELGPQLLDRISRPDIRATVVVAKREFEAWLLAGAVSLRGRHGVSAAAEAPADPETIRGAKEYLQRNLLEAGRVYRETVDQAELTRSFGLTEARRAPSFDKFCRELHQLLSGLQP